ncbi:MAG TPA: hypothetical protein VIO61_02160 [Anaerolineaceae bacterium]
MTVLDRIAYFQNQRDEVPNQQLARQLAETNDETGIREIAENLWNRNPNIQSDCLKVLYETGYIQPELIVPYIEGFLRLLKSKNNRMVWGAMIALSTIAHLQSGRLFAEVETLKTAIQSGSVITTDAGIKTLSIVAASSPERCRSIFPYLLSHLQTCRPVDLPRHAEQALPALNDEFRPGFLAILQARLTDLGAAQAARVRKVIKQASQFSPDHLE